MLITHEEYLNKIRGMIAGNEGGRGVPYFDGHLPRFMVQLGMFDRYLMNEDISLIYDLGSDLPFSSLYLAINKDAIVKCGCVDVKDGVLDERAIQFYLNLNRPVPLPVADLVICTECLEHLPSNLYRVREALSGYVRNNGFLLLSFPLNGMNAGNYGADIEGWDINVGHAHIREFTAQTAKDFCTVSGFKIIAEETVWTNAYGGNIMNVLMKKDVYS